MVSRVILGLLAALALPAASGPAKDDLAGQFSGRVAGKPVDCINPQDVQSTRIVEGHAIIYDSYGTLFVNTPLSGGDHLRWDDVLVQRIEGSQLCRIDTVGLVDPATRFQRAFVVLGDFVPYTKVKKGRAGQG